MAQAKFKVIKDQVTLPKFISERTSVKDPKKKVPLYEHIVYSVGDVVDEDDLAPVVIKRFNEGDERTLTQIEKVPEKSEK